MDKLKIGFIPAHRDLMDEEYAVFLRDMYLRKLSGSSQIEIIIPDKNITDGGLVRNYEDSKKVIGLFKKKQIDALIIGVLTFGDERSVFNIVEEFPGSPIFLFAAAEPEIPKDKFFRSAAPCGLLPISFGLNRREMKFTYGGILKPDDKEFDSKIDSFFKTVRGIKKFIGARIGMIGSRPNEFEVCASNEALMIRKFSQKIIHFNLLDLRFQIEDISDEDPEIKKIIKEIMSSAACDFEQKELLKVAKLEYLILKYAKDNDIDAFAIQCWSSIQKYIGLTPCMTNGRITDLGYPVSCEGDANGALSMLIQQAMVTGKKTPSLVDILTAHPDEDKLVLAWHCGNASVSNKHAESDARIMPQCPWSDKFGRKAGAASMELMLKSGFSTINSLIEHNGQYKLSNFFVEMVKRDDNIRGAWSWFEVPDREKFYEKLVYEGFPHHTSLIYEDLRDPIKEFCRYLDIRCIGF